MRVFIWACESFYGGLHGIFNQVVAEVNSVEDADDWGREMGEELRETYDLYSEEEIIEACGEDADDDMIWEYLNETYCPEWIVYKIKDSVKESIQELDSIAYKLGYELFIEEYCDKEALY